MKLNSIQNIYGAKKNSKRVGRGIGSGKGKTCGKGVKGQKARSGIAIKGFEGGQMPLHRRLPKRGFSNTKFSRKIQTVNVYLIETLIKSNHWPIEHVINKEVLYKAGLIKNLFLPLKLLAKGNITLPINIEVDLASANVINKINSLGGKVILALK